MSRVNQCKECHRIFHMDDRDDADEWYYGHDCETQEELKGTDESNPATS